MVHENSQFEMPGIQLRESKTQPRVSLSREIGEAQITHTIFGKAKVRIIRKHDKLHRALWLTAAVVVTAIAGAVWQGWFSFPQIEFVQSTDLKLPVSSDVQASSPVSQVENTAAGNVVPAAAALPLKSEPSASSVPQIRTLGNAQKVVPQQSQGMHEAVGAVAKPVLVQQKPVAVQPIPITSQPATTVSPQRAPLAASSSVAKTVPDKPLLPKQPAVPALAPTPAAKPVAMPLAASSPGAVSPSSSPLMKESSSLQLPASANQLSSPINPQSK
jgi:hypothetical protein